MDSLHAIGFYVSSGVLLIGALGVALLPRRDLRGAALAVSGLGLAGVYYSLSAGFAGAVAFVCYAGCALMVAGPQYRTVEAVAGSAWRQVGAIGAAMLLAVLAFSAFRGDFVTATFKGGPFDAVALARLLFAHDVVATEAVALLGLIAIAGAAAAWRLRERAR
jgi:NADH:ubiquinone oxidoreductase subunit 6 (subunit J)